MHSLQNMLDVRICEHNRRKSRCKFCLGSVVCEHQKRKSRCDVCSEICEHVRPKSQEVVSTIKKRDKHKKCPHGRREYCCKQCEGTGICEHLKRRGYWGGAAGAAARGGDTAHRAAVARREQLVSRGVAPVLSGGHGGLLRGAKPA